MERNRGKACARGAQDARAARRCPTPNQGGTDMSVENFKKTNRQDDQPAPMHVARELTQGGPIALIEHKGQIYSLRITRADKLILTK